MIWSTACDFCVFRDIQNSKRLRAPFPSLPQRHISVLGQGVPNGHFHRGSVIANSTPALLAPLLPLRSPLLHSSFSCCHCPPELPFHATTAAVVALQFVTVPPPRPSPTHRDMGPMDQLRRIRIPRYPCRGAGALTVHAVNGWRSAKKVTCPLSPVDAFSDHSKLHSPEVDPLCDTKRCNCLPPSPSLPPSVSLALSPCATGNECGLWSGAEAGLSLNRDRERERERERETVGGREGEGEGERARETEGGEGKVPGLWYLSLLVARTATGNGCRLLRCPLSASSPEPPAAVQGCQAQAILEVCPPPPPPRATQGSWAKTCAIHFGGQRPLLDDGDQ